MSPSMLLGPPGEVPGNNSVREVTGVPTGDRGESVETVLGLWEEKRSMKSRKYSM